MQVEPQVALPKIMLARYCGSNLGRFLSVDPSFGSAEETKPQSWNRYQYSYNNPIEFVDPNGKIPFSELKRTNPEVARRILQASAQVRGAISASLGSRYTPDFTDDRAFDYWPMYVGVLPRGVALFGGFQDREIAAEGGSSANPKIGLKHYPGQPVGLGLVEQDGLLSDGVLRGVLFVGAYTNEKPGMSGLLEAVRQMVVHSGTGPDGLQLSDDDIEVLRKIIKALKEELTNEEAAERFSVEVDRALSAFSDQVER